VRDGHCDTAKLLLEKGADKNSKTKARAGAAARRAGAVCEAAAAPRARAAALTRGRLQEGYTALILAAEGGHLEAVRLLMSKGAAVTEFNSVMVHSSTGSKGSRSGMDQV